MFMNSRQASEAAPIHRLPPEVLSIIFEVGKSAVERHNHVVPTVRTLPFEVVVSHVTSHWRNVAISSSWLWNTIESTFSEPMALERLSAYLARSKAYPLDVDLEIYQNPFTFDRSIMLHMILPHVARWRRFSLGTNIGEVSKIIHTHFRSLSAPLLEHMSVSTDEDAEHVHLADISDTQPQIFACGAPNLSFVQLGAFMIHTMRPPLTATTTLKLVEGDAGNPHATPFRVEFSELRRMLVALPGLINLSLDSDVVHSTSWPISDSHANSIEMPGLRSLRIDMFTFLNFVTAPSLESLVLRDCADSQNWEELNFPKFTVLRSITFYNCLFWGFKNFFQVFPAITDFTVDANDCEIMEFLGVGNGSEVAESSRSRSDIPWPHLTVMSIPSLPSDSSCKAFLCNMVSSRKHAKRPIERLRLGPNVMDKMKGFGRLGWLKEQVQVVQWDGRDFWPPLPASSFV